MYLRLPCCLVVLRILEIGTLDSWVSGLESHPHVPHAVLVRVVFFEEKHIFNIHTHIHMHTPTPATHSLCFELFIY